MLQRFSVSLDVNEAELPPPKSLTNDDFGFAALWLGEDRENRVRTAPFLWPARLEYKIGNDALNTDEVPPRISDECKGDGIILMAL